MGIPFKSERKTPLMLWVSILSALILTAFILDAVFLPGSADVTESADSLIAVYDVGQATPPDTTITTQQESSKIRNLKTEKPSPENPWVALVIDDFGPAGTYNILPYFLDLPKVITVSVIPGNAKSKEAGEMIRNKGVDLLIHLPMEPENNVAMNEPDMLMTRHNKFDITHLIERVSAQLPGAVGMNSHMGSKATKDKRLMTDLARELNNRGYLFYDSWTVRGTIAQEVMTSEGVPAVKRDVFLDNVRDEELIKRQYDSLINIAHKRGWAIGTGHCNRVMLAFLQEKLQADTDVTFVSIKTLMDAITVKKR